MQALRHLTAPAVGHDWLTMAQLAEHGRFMASDGIHFSAEAARKFVHNHPDLPFARRGKHLLVDRGVFDRYIAAAATVPLRPVRRYYCAMCEEWFTKGGDCRLCGAGLDRAASTRRTRAS